MGQAGPVTELRHHRDSNHEKRSDTVCACLGLGPNSIALGLQLALALSLSLFRFGGLLCRRPLTKARIELLEGFVGYISHSRGSIPFSSRCIPSVQGELPHRDSLFDADSHTNESH